MPKYFSRDVINGPCCLNSTCSGCFSSNYFIQYSLVCGTDVEDDARQMNSQIADLSVINNESIFVLWSFLSSLNHFSQNAVRRAWPTVSPRMHQLHHQSPTHGLSTFRMCGFGAVFLFCIISKTIYKQAVRHLASFRFCSCGRKET